MFDWLWKLLYSLSEILFEIADSMLGISNRLCGVEPIELDGEEVNFIDVLTNNNVVMYGFGGAALIGIFLLMIFGTIAICRNMKDGKKTSTEIFVQVLKTVGMFMIIPALMFGFSMLLNELVKLLYSATRGGANQTLGKFLFKSFMPSSATSVTMNQDIYVDWRDVNSVQSYMAKLGYDLSDYRFFFSWIITIPIIWCVAKALFLFVDRTLSIVILFIMAPISMATSVLDDGARFKFWRDKVITKYISGYGMVIAVNVYILVLSFVTRSDVSFIPGDGLINWMADFLIKMAFAIGGAYFLPNVFSLAADVFTNGGASGEYRNTQDTLKEMKQDYEDYKKEQKEKEEQEEKERQEEEKAQQALNSGRGGRGGGGGGFGGGGGGRGGGKYNNAFTRKLADTAVGKQIAGIVAGMVGGPAGDMIKKAAENGQLGNLMASVSGDGGGSTGGGGRGSGNSNNKSGLVAGAETVKDGISALMGGKGGK